MRIENSVALVTGANRGIGRELASQLMQRGAHTVYAASRDVDAVDLTGVVPLRLDVTDTTQVAAAAEAASDATLIINNAGFSSFATLTDGDMTDIRKEMETNYFGTLHMVRAFAPVLRRNGGGALLNISSVMAWLGHEHSNSYGASKAANWALTNGVREELAGTNIQVSSLFLGSTDTDMMAAFDGEKSRPEEIAATALDQLEQGVLEILADESAHTLKSALSTDRGVFLG